MQALCDKAPIKTLDTESELPWQAILCADCLQCDQAVHDLVERGLLEPPCLDSLWTRLYVSCLFTDFNLYPFPLTTGNVSVTVFNEFPYSF